MSLPLKRKVEKVISGWLSTGSIAALANHNYYHGLRMAAKAPPCIIIAVTSTEPSWQTGNGNATPFDGKVDVVLKTKCAHASDHTSDTAETAHYDGAEAIETRLANFSGLKAYALAENVTNRPVTAFYISELTAPSSRFLYDEKEQCFVTIQTFGFTAIASDCTD
ncbi:MAG: hypothetical protein EBR82_19105 [Caulobacteraceae bacterium]|nr:hypothetical protein [Caulobacteraceae bacterium]